MSEREYQAIAVSALVTAREMNNGRILLFTPSDQTEVGHVIPVSEIYLSRQEIARLAEWSKSHE